MNALGAKRNRPFQADVPEQIGIRKAAILTLRDVAA